MTFLASDHCKQLLTLFTFLLISFSGLNGCSAEKETDWVVVNYWAIWCAPCREEIPELNELAKVDPGKISVFGVNFDEPDLATLLSQSETLNIQFPNMSAAQALELGLEKPNTLPTTYILYQGQVAHRLIGPQTQETLLAKMQKTPQLATQG